MLHVATKEIPNVPAKYAYYNVMYNSYSTLDHMQMSAAQMWAWTEAHTILYTTVERFCLQTLLSVWNKMPCTKLSGVIGLCLGSALVWSSRVPTGVMAPCTTLSCLSSSFSKYVHHSKTSYQTSMTNQAPYRLWVLWTKTATFARNTFLEEW